MENLYTRKHLATQLGVTTRTIFNYEKVGMPVIVIGRNLKRYDYAKVMEWINLKEQVKAIHKVTDKIDY